ncbi:transaldolase [Candidatus Berkelbacteria bacterium]|nr:transaldolase [Candidatus Berkelbacteria bacterium]
MKPQGLKTKIFVDSGDPSETRKVLNYLGFLDGQTTNPTLISKNPEAAGKDPISFYRQVVQEIASVIPDGSISIEVYADHKTTAQEMLHEGREMFSWIPNAHVKFPTTAEGLKAANRAVQEGLRVNMTLVFSQEQAAAVYAATLGAKRGDVYVSPFIGRLDDRGENGMDLIANIIKMYAAGDGHVELLTASVRSVDQLLAAIALGSDIVTCPPEKVLKPWHEQGMPLPDAQFRYERPALSPIPDRDISLTNSWDSYDISHDLTTAGLEKFASDWNELMGGKRA